MGFRKFGEGEVLPEEDDLAKTASQEWTEEDQRELDEENARVDGDDD